MRRVLVLVCFAFVLVGCADYSDAKPGKVVDWGKRYVVVVQDADQQRVTIQTSKAVARRCRKAEIKRWPDCA